MSKNFELMQEALRETLRETPVISESNEVVFPISESNRNKQGGPSDFDPVAQQECFKLVQRVFLGKEPNLFRNVVFAAVDRGDGCSRICVEVARILAANTSGSVCLVDANFRAPSLAGFLELPNHRGLVDSVLEDGGIRGFANQMKPANLWLLSAGNLVPESPSLLNSDRIKLRLKELRNEFDYVLIDVPALNDYADAIALGRIADGVVVVLKADSTRRESALKAVASLREAQIEVLGAVLNRRTFPIPAFVYRRL